MTARRTPARKAYGRQTAARKVNPAAAKARAANGGRMPPPKVQNPVPAKSKPLAYKQRGWYIANRDGDGFLSGLKCPICQRAFKAGQSAYAWTTSTSTTSNNYYGYGRVRRYQAMHGVCMAVEAESSPAEKWTEIRNRLAAGKGLFDDDEK